MSTLTVMAGATLTPALPAMRNAFQYMEHSSLLVMLVVSLPGLVVAFSAPLVGFILDRWQKKYLLLAATLVYGIAGVSGYFLQQSLWGILLGRIFLGFAVAGIMVATTTLIADYYPPEERGRYIGLQAAFGGFGGVLFMFFGGFLADVHWATPFLLYTLALFILPGLMLFTDEPERTEKLAKQAVQPLATSRPLLLSGYAMAFIEMVALYMVPLHLPFYLNEHAEFQAQNSATLAGASIAMMLLVMALIASAYGYFREVFRFPIIQAIGLAILSLGYAALALSHSVTTLVLALMLSGVGLGLMRPNLVTWIMSKTAAQSRGRVMGGITTFFFLGQFFAPLITQPIIALSGFANSFLIVAAALCLLAVIYLANGLSITISGRAKASAESR